ncbi:LytR/AlgR family response regulator transcription factor [Terrisporobacter vanillatitrophus]|uniref:LytR/AlgR family response regulator transcription factor n=1 Tax=Terrisporobacter vanillatitrophus TaxID=3058402 RepID=UPI003367D426
MKVIIVDDEYPSRKELRYFIEKYTEMEIVDEFDNGLDVLNFIQENTLDAIFLDINIPKLDGMLLAKTINKFEIKPKIVFITAYDNYAVEAFNLDTFDYILKPYSDERIISMLNKLKSAIIEDNCKDKIEHQKDKIEHQKVSNKISLWKNDKIHIVNVNDIYYCEAKERYTHIFTEDEEYEIRESLSEIEKTINKENFFRSHRSYLVNLEKIEEIIPWFNNTYILKLNKGKYEITVSRGKVKLFRQLMNI